MNEIYVTKDFYISLSNTLHSTLLEVMNVFQCGTAMYIGVGNLLQSLFNLFKYILLLQLPLILSAVWVDKKLCQIKLFANQKIITN